MIEVWVVLKSAVTGDTTRLGRMTICNDGAASQQNPEVGDYVAEVMRKPDFTLPTRKTGIVGHKRHKLPIWSLVAKALNGMGYGDMK